MQTRGTQAYFYHADALGSIEANTDMAGNAVQRYGYDAWGNIIYNSGAFSVASGNSLNRLRSQDVSGMRRRSCTISDREHTIPARADSCRRTP